MINIKQLKIASIVKRSLGQFNYEKKINSLNNRSKVRQLSEDCSAEANIYGKNSSDTSWDAVVFGMKGLATSIGGIAALQSSAGASLLAATGTAALQSAAGAVVVGVTLPVGAMAVGTILVGNIAYWATKTTEVN